MASLRAASSSDQAELPSELKVGPFRYTVSRSPAENHLSEGQRIGASDHKSLEIALLDGLARDAEAETLMHEVLHCAVNVAGKPLTYEDEEAAVRAMSAPLLDILRSNPELVAYLLGA